MTKLNYNLSYDENQTSTQKEAVDLPVLCLLS